MTNLNEPKRHSRSVRRLGMIASGLALALIVLWAARVLALAGSHSYERSVFPTACPVTTPLQTVSAKA